MSNATNETAVPVKINIQDVITVTARLAQLMAEEVDLLNEMKISKIDALQKEKLFLTNALEAQRKLIEKHPYTMDTIPSQDRKDLQEVVEVFNNILEENQRKLMLAKEVNQRIVQAVTQVVRESTARTAYDVTGSNSQAPFETLSITLNQTI